MAGRRPACLPWLVGALALLPASAARAQVAEPAAATEVEERYRELIRLAIAEYESGHSEEALALFEQAYALRPTARVLRGMAKAQFELGSYARAVSTIDHALAATDDPLTDSLRDELRALRERAMRYVGHLQIVLVPANAGLSIDGRPVAASELARPLALDVGKHAFEARAPGHRDLSRVVEVAGGSSARVVLALEATKPATPTVVVEQRTLLAPSRAPLYLTAAAAAAGAAGVVAGSVWYASRSDAVDRCSAAAGGGARCTNADEIATARDASMWTIGASAAVALGAGIAFVLLVSGDEAPARAAATPPLRWSF